MVKLEVKEPKMLFKEIANLIDAHYRHPHELSFIQNYPEVYRVYLGLAALGYGSRHKIGTLVVSP